MPIPDDLSVALARLSRLGHHPDATIRPVLLRVVVDLFLQKQHHAPEDLTTFEAMVAPLLDDLDGAARRQLIERLFDHPATPAALLDRLMDDESRIAADVYRHASFSPSELLAAAEDGPAMVAATVAQRADLPADVVRALVARPETRIVHALADNPAVTFAPADIQRLVRRAQVDHDLAERLAGRAIDPIALAPLFPFVSPPRRRGIIDAVRRMELGRRQWGRPDGATSATLARLDRLILSGEWESFDYALCVALGCEQRALRPLLHDGTGEIFALALAAAGVTAEIAARAFILGEPTIGRSVPAVRRLTALVDTVAPTAARRLLNAMIEGGTTPQRRPAPPAMPAPAARRAEAAAETAAQRRSGAEPARRQQGA